MARVLVVGVPRSGTTWVATVLGQTVGTTYVEEPDNHFRFAFALRAKRRLGQGEFPYPRSDDGVARSYAELWDEAFASVPSRRTTVGDALRRRLADAAVERADVARMSLALCRGRSGVALRVLETLAVPRRPPRAASHVLVKSVYAQLALEWIAERYSCSVVVVTRNPLAVVSSWVELGWLTHPRWEPLDALAPDIRDSLVAARALPKPPATSRLARSAWLVGLLTERLQAAAARHPDWRVVAHEDLCASPLEAFREVAGHVQLEWSVDAEQMLARLDRRGTGLAVARVAAAAADSWRGRLDAAQVAEVERTLRRFPIEDWRTLR